METELDIPLTGESIGLAMLLDGRESVAVPSYRTMEGGVVTRFRACVAGPLLVLNLSDMPMNVEVAQSNDFQELARWLEGSWLTETQSLTIAAFKAEIVSPVKTYLGLKHDAVTGLLRPVGVLSRGPSSMPFQEPAMIQLG